MKRLRPSTLQAEHPVTPAQGRLRHGRATEMVRRGTTSSGGEGVECGAAWQEALAERSTETTSSPPPLRRRNPRTQAECDAIVDSWRRISLQLNVNDQTAARAFIVCRARRIWGGLGIKLRDSVWCQTWRATHMIPIRIFTYVKRWVGR